MDSKTTTTSMSSSIPRNDALSSSATPSSGLPDHQAGLSTGQIVGIVLGVVAFLGVVMLSAFLGIRHLNRVKAAIASSECSGSIRDPGYASPECIAKLEQGETSHSTAPTEIGSKFTEETSRTFLPTEGPSRPSVDDDQGTEKIWGLDSPSSSGLESESSRIVSTVDECKRQAVNNIMNEVKSLLNNGLYVGMSIKAGAGRPSNESSSAGVSSITSSERTSSSHGISDFNKNGKRPINCDSQRSSEESDGNEGDGKRPRGASSVNDFIGSKFACPFFQRTPRKHLKHRSCAGPGWPSVHRVKEHVYRCHTVPIHCDRCGTIFPDNGSLKNHHRQLQACPMKPLSLPEGIDEEQKSVLRKKKRCKSEKERWVEMYRVLFPDEDEDLIPSPHYDYRTVASIEQEGEDELARYMRFQRRELLRSVRVFLEEAASEMTGTLEDQLRHHLGPILRKAQDQVLLSYRSSSHASQSTDVSGSGITLEELKVPVVDQDSQPVISNHSMVENSPFRTTDDHSISSRPTMRNFNPSLFEVDSMFIDPLFHPASGTVDDSNAGVQARRIQSDIEENSNAMDNYCFNFGH